MCCDIAAFQLSLGNFAAKPAVSTKTHRREKPQLPRLCCVVNLSSRFYRANFSIRLALYPFRPFAFHLLRAPARLFKQGFVIDGIQL